MKKPNIAILGATGVVGREITKITEELNVEFESIKFLSSARSAGSKILFKGKEYTVKSGDTIESISKDNKISTQEFLISNPEFTSEDNIFPRVLWIAM